MILLQDEWREGGDNIVEAFLVHLIFSSPFPLSSSSLLLRLQEKHTRESLKDHLTNISSLQYELKHVYEQIKELQMKMKQGQERQRQLLEAHGNK